jgi:hypothetical protein
LRREAGRSGFGNSARKMSKIKLIVEFLDDSHSFALGFEAGKLYEQMRNEQTEINGAFNKANSGQLMLMARNLGYEVTEILSLDEIFVNLRFKFKPPSADCF